MKRIVCSLLFFLCCSQMVAQKLTPVPIVTFEQLAALIQPSAETVKVINFWATWCKPCVAEMPSFERLQKEYGAKGVAVTLVSLDFKRDLEKRVLPFVRGRKLQSRVLLLDGGNPNTWIDRVSKDWSGAIPATLIVPRFSATRSGSTNARIFHEGELTFDSLVTKIQPLLAK